MRVYLIAAPEDQAEAEKLAEYLKRFGVFIRTDFGQMAYPPAQHGEFTLALWSRNAMMSSRQMMLTNRAIDAWEEGRLVMARLEHGLSPRGLADLDMVDLTFAAAREHRYHDVLNAIRAMEDQRRAELQTAELEHAQQAMLSQAEDRDMAAPGQSGSASADEAIAPLDLEEEDSPAKAGTPQHAAASAKRQSRGVPVVKLMALLLIVLGIGGAVLVGVMPNTFGTDGETGTQRAVILQELDAKRTEINQLQAQMNTQIQIIRSTESARGEDIDVSENEERVAELRGELDAARTAEIELAERAGVLSENAPDDRMRGDTGGLSVNSPLILGAIAAGGLILILIIWRLLRPSKVKRAAAEPLPAAPKMAEPDAPKGVDTENLDTFVSYSHHNAEAVLPIIESIEADGITVWIDRDELRVGQNWAGQIVRAIKAADRFCLMCSAQAFESDHVRREVYLADKYGKTMVPVRLDDSEMPEDIEYFLIGRQWVDMFSVDEKERSQALKAILTNLEN